MIDMINSLDYFTSLVRQDDCIPLFEAALAIAQDAYPQLDLAAPQAEIDILAAQLKRRLPSDAPQIQKLRALNQYFYRELGFVGNINDYYDPANSYLHRVITTRRGIPISLAMVYMEMAHQIGLNIQGISFPGHFLMKLSVQSGDIILDPFNGLSLTRENLEERLESFLPREAIADDLRLSDHLQSAHPREILVRMLHNLKSLFMASHDWQRLLGVQERLVILCPGEIAERRDRGLAFAELDHPHAALEDLEAYLTAHPYSQDAESLRTKLPGLRETGKRPGQENPYT